MTVRDWITSGVKTAVQVLVAAAIGWLAQWGIEVDEASLEAVLFAVTSGAVAIVLNWLADRFPPLARILSLGMAKSGPTYS